MKKVVVLLVCLFLVSAFAGNVFAIGEDYKPVTGVMDITVKDSTTKLFAASDDVKSCVSGKVKPSDKEEVIFVGKYNSGNTLCALRYDETTKKMIDVTAEMKIGGFILSIMAMTFNDLNGDNNPDLAITTAYYGVFVYINDGQGKFLPVPVYLDQFWAMGLDISSIEDNLFVSNFNFSETVKTYTPDKINGDRKPKYTSFPGFAPFSISSDKYGSTPETTIATIAVGSWYISWDGKNRVYYSCDLATYADVPETAPDQKYVSEDMNAVSVKYNNSVVSIFWGTANNNILKGDCKNNYKSEDGCYHLFQAIIDKELVLFSANYNNKNGAYLVSTQANVIFNDTYTKDSTDCIFATDQYVVWSNHPNTSTSSQQALVIYRKSKSIDLFYDIYDKHIDKSQYYKPAPAVSGLPTDNYIPTSNSTLPFSFEVTDIVGLYKIEYIQITNTSNTTNLLLDYPQLKVMDLNANNPEKPYHYSINTSVNLLEGEQRIILVITNCTGSVSYHEFLVNKFTIINSAIKNRSSKIQTQMNGLLIPPKDGLQLPNEYFWRNFFVKIRKEKPAEMSETDFDAHVQLSDYVHYNSSYNNVLELTKDTDETSNWYNSEYLLYAPIIPNDYVNTKRWKIVATKASTSDAWQKPATGLTPPGDDTLNLALQQITKASMVVNDDDDNYNGIIDLEENQLSAQEDDTMIFFIEDCPTHYITLKCDSSRVKFYNTNGKPIADLSSLVINSFPYPIVIEGLTHSENQNDVAIEINKPLENITTVANITVYNIDYLKIGYYDLQQNNLSNLKPALNGDISISYPVPNVTITNCAPTYVSLDEEKGLIGGVTVQGYASFDFYNLLDDSTLKLEATLEVAGKDIETVLLEPVESTNSTIFIPHPKQYYFTFNKSDVKFIPGGNSIRIKVVDQFIFNTGWDCWTFSTVPSGEINPTWSVTTAERMQKSNEGPYTPFVIEIKGPINENNSVKFMDVPYNCIGIDGRTFISSEKIGAPLLQSSLNSNISTKSSKHQIQSVALFGIGEKDLNNVKTPYLIGPGVYKDNKFVWRELKITIGENNVGWNFTSQTIAIDSSCSKLFELLSTIAKERRAERFGITPSKSYVIPYDDGKCYDLDGVKIYNNNLIKQISNLNNALSDNAVQLKKDNDKLARLQLTFTGVGGGEGILMQIEDLQNNIKYLNAVKNFGYPLTVTNLTYKQDSVKYSIENSKSMLAGDASQSDPYEKFMNYTERWLKERLAYRNSIKVNQIWKEEDWDEAFRRNIYKELVETHPEDVEGLYNVSVYLLKDLQKYNYSELVNPYGLLDHKYFIKNIVPQEIKCFTPGSKYLIGDYKASKDGEDIVWDFKSQTQNMSQFIHLNIGIGWDRQAIFKQIANIIKTGSDDERRQVYEILKDHFNFNMFPIINGIDFSFLGITYKVPASELQLDTKELFVYASQNKLDEYLTKHFTGKTIKLTINGKPQEKDGLVFYSYAKQFFGEDMRLGEQHAHKTWVKLANIALLSKAIGDINDMDYSLAYEVQTGEGFVVFGIDSFNDVIITEGGTLFGRNLQDPKIPMPNMKVFTTELNKMINQGRNKFLTHKLMANKNIRVNAFKAIQMATALGEFKPVATRYKNEEIVIWTNTAGMIVTRNKVNHMSAKDQEKFIEEVGKHLRSTKRYEKTGEFLTDIESKSLDQAVEMMMFLEQDVIAQ